MADRSTSSEPASPSTPVRITRVGIVAKRNLRQASKPLSELAEWLERRGIRPIFDEETASLLASGSPAEVLSREKLPLGVDLIVVLGGDGTLLACASRIAQAGADIPILGVNFGSLGFLTEIRLDELYPSLDATIAGHARLDDRMMLQVSVLAGSEVIFNQTALNDVVITKGALSRMIDLSVTVNDTFVARFKADGLIVASPTGSTAYNLAAGGPIVHPVMNAMVMTPIAPHTLTNRPIVIPSSSIVRMQPLPDGNTDDIWVTVDGQTASLLAKNHVVRVEQASRRVRVVRASSRSYFEVLREKLKWAER